MKTRLRTAAIGAGLGLVTLVALSTRSDPGPPHESWLPAPVQSHVVKAQAHARVRSDAVVPQVAQRKEPRSASEAAEVLKAIPADAPNVVVVDPGVLFALPVGGMILRCLRQAGGLPDGKLDLTQVKRLAVAQLADGRGLSVAAGGDEPSDGSESASAQCSARADARDGPSAGARGVTTRRHGDLTIRGDEEVVRDSLRRLQTTSDDPPGIGPNEDYGDVHGRLDVQLVSGMFPPDLAEQVRRTDARFEFHLDATDGLQLTIDALGTNGPIKGLGAAIERSLATMRAHARDAEDATLRRLLDSSSLIESADGIRLEATLPLDLVASLLGPCAASDHDAE